MTGAVKRALSYTWLTGLHRIESTPETSDVPGIDFLEELGMRFEGIRRHGGYIDNAWRDLSVYATTKGEELI